MYAPASTRIQARHLPAALLVSLLAHAALLLAVGQLRPHDGPADARIALEVAVRRLVPEARPARPEGGPNAGAEAPRRTAPRSDPRHLERAPALAAPAPHPAEAQPHAEAEAPAPAPVTAAAAPKSDPGPTAPPLGVGAAVASAAIAGGAPPRAGSTEETPGGGPGEQARGDLRGYHRNLYRAVSAAKRYPEDARRLGLEGHALLAVRIDRAGRIVGKPRVLESTRHDVLDDEALRMVESAAPFPPLPASYGGPDAEFKIPVKFFLRD